MICDMFKRDLTDISDIFENMLRSQLNLRFK